MIWTLTLYDFLQAPGFSIAQLKPWDLKRKMLAGVVAHTFIPARVGQFKDSLRYAASKTLSLKTMNK